MGGFGSGGHNKKKSTTLEFLRLDIRTLSEYGLFDSKNALKYSWVNQYTNCVHDSIIIWVKNDNLVISDDINIQNDNARMVEKIPLQWTNCNFGGMRVWFTCKCGRRAAILYKKNGKFKCRVCQNLNYPSNQENRRDILNVIARKIFKTQDKLHCPHNIDLISNINKPKGMHQSTYSSLTGKLFKLHVAYKSAFIDELKRKFGSRLN